VDAKGVDYARLTALLIEAVKEQQALLLELQAQLAVVKAQLNRSDDNQVAALELQE
jgi:hypothetical protein